jgi:hypothetical protein
VTPGKSAPDAEVRVTPFRALRCVPLIGLFGMLLIPAMGQGIRIQPEIVRSVSGQFIVKTTTLQDPPRAVLNLTAKESFILLQPALLTVSCERIRQALNQLLDANSPWQGRIYLVLYPAATSNDTVYVTSERFKDGWQYQVQIPQVLGRERYVAAMTQVLLLELANRRNPAVSAEIPVWLSDGLARNLLSVREVQLVLAPPSKTVNGLPVNSTMVNLKAENPLELAHRQLTLNEPLSFQELSWPAPEQLLAEAGERFRSSAQLLVKELLALPEGRPCLRNLVMELSAHLNWQIAFLRAFNATFQRPLDVEKWWALHTACFAGRDLAQTWAAEESWRKLDQALRTPVEIRGQTNDLPLRGDTTLQTILRDWAPQPRDEAIKAKLAELYMVRLRLLPEMVPLLDEYRRVLSEFLQKVAGSQRGFFSVDVDRRTINGTVKELDALDARRKSAITNWERANPRPPAQFSTN